MNKKIKVAVVGSINMDMTVKAERIPLKGETLKGGDLQYVPGGKGANQAVAMSRIGADVGMFGCVGNDATGQVLLENLKEQGVNIEHIEIVEGVASGIALITIGENDNTIVIVAGANGCVDIAYIKKIEKALLEYDMVVLQHEIPEETLEYVVDYCWENKIQVLLNPAPAREVSEDTIEKVSYLTPNEHEAAILFGKEKSLEELLKAYPNKLIVTLGAEGVAVGLENGEVLKVPGRRTQVVDTTGAGDTLNGAFAVQVAEGKSMKEALYFANVAASLSIEKFGAQGGMPTREEVEGII